MTFRPFLAVSAFALVLSSFGTVAQEPNPNPTNEPTPEEQRQIAEAAAAAELKATLNPDRIPTDAASMALFPKGPHHTIHSWPAILTNRAEGVTSYTPYTASVIQIETGLNRKD